MSSTKSSREPAIWNWCLDRKLQEKESVSGHRYSAVPERGGKILLLTREEQEASLHDPEGVETD